MIADNLLTTRNDILLFFSTMLKCQSFCDLTEVFTVKWHHMKFGNCPPLERLIANKVVFQYNNTEHVYFVFVDIILTALF